MTKTDADSTREQGVVGDMFEQLRTPLYAALGAGDLATQAVVDVVNRARGQAPVDVDQLREKLDTAELRKLVDTEELRRIVDVDELRKLVDNYSQAALDLYTYLAEQGEGTFDKFRAQPQVKRALDQLEEAVNLAQQRVEGVTGDARGIAEDVLSKVTHRTRATGEKAARGTQRTASKAADAVDEAGDELASHTRSTARKAANKTASAEAKVAAEQTGGASKAVKPEQRGGAGRTNGTGGTQK